MFRSKPAPFCSPRARATLKAALLRSATNSVPAPSMGKAHCLEPPHAPRIVRQAVDADFLFRLNDLFQALEEPRVEMRNRVDPLNRETLAQCFGGNQQPVGRRPRQLALNRRRI